METTATGIARPSDGAGHTSKTVPSEAIANLSQLHTTHLPPECRGGPAAR